MSIVILKVTEHLLTLGSNTLITEGSQNVDGVKVEFDSSWNGYAKIVVFSKKNQLEYTVLDENGFGKIPNEILTSNSEINICVIGIKDSVQLTTNIIKFKIYDSLELVLEEPDKDVYRQILTQYERISGQFEKLQYEIQTTKNVVKDLNMKLVETLLPVHKYTKGQCDVYRMGNLILLDCNILTAGVAYEPVKVFEYSNEIPVAKTKITIGTDKVSVYNEIGTRDIYISHPASADDGCTGTLIFITEPEDGEFYFNTKIVETLPVGEQIDTNCIYFIPKEISEEISKDYKKYNKYVYIDGAWELINEDDEAILVNAYKGSSGYIYFYRLLNRMIIEFRDFTCTSKIDISLPNKAKAIRKYSSKISNTNIVISGNSLSIEISTEAINGMLEVVLGNKLQGVYLLNSPSKIFATNPSSVINFEAIAMGGNESYRYNHKVINIDTGDTFESGTVTNSIYEWEAITSATRIHYCEITDSSGKKINTNKITGITTELPAVIHSDKNLINNYDSQVGESFEFMITPVDSSIKYEYQFSVINSIGSETIVKKYGTSNVYTGAWVSADTKTIVGYIKDSEGNITRLNSITIKVE